MKRLLFISHSNDMHGAETVGIEVIRTLHNAGHEVYVVCPSLVKPGMFEKTVVELVGNDHLLRLPYRSAGKGCIRGLFVEQYNKKTLRQLITFCEDKHIDIIYSNTFTTILGIQLASRLNLPHFWHIHEPASRDFGWWQSMRKTYRELISYKKNTTIFISTQQAEQWEKELKTNIKGKIIYNPIKTLEIHKITKDKTTFGFIGSFDKRKNITLLIDCFDELHRKNPNTELQIVGANSSKEIERIYGITTLTKNTLTVTQYMSAEDFYAQTDILVLPSKSETMPLVSIEAMQAGICVIQTKNSFMNELYEDQKDCLFVNPQREELLRAMEKTIREDFRQQLISSARKKTKKYAFNDNFKTKLLQLIN